MQFLDDSLFPENQEPLVIQVAPYAPSFLPRDSDDIAVTLDEQVQKAVDCYNAGATVLHVHVREADGTGSKRMSMFNEMLARLRDAVPKMILQVGGSISFAPEGEGTAAKWLSDDTRHMLADLNPKPEQVTVAINTNQMNVMELIGPDDCAGTSMSEPAYYNAYREMTIPAGPGFVDEHLRRLQAARIQPHFMLGDVGQLETVERMIRRGAYTGPLDSQLGCDRRRSRRSESAQHDGVHQQQCRTAPCSRSRASCATFCRSTRWRSPWGCTSASVSRTTCGAAKASE